MNELEARLTDLGDALDVGDPIAAADAIVGRLDEPRRAHHGHRRWLLQAAAAVIVVAATVLAVPRTRQALADWLGLRGVRIERQDRPTGGVPTPFVLPGPGDSRTATVDGRQILVSTIRGALDDALLGKVAGPGTGVRRVAVGGHPGVWVDGDPHDVVYLLPDRDVAVTRVAGNTLLWQVGDVLHRVEGFADQASAVAFAVTGT